MLKAYRIWGNYYNYTEERETHSVEGVWGILYVGNNTESEFGSHRRVQRFFFLKGYITETNIVFKSLKEINFKEIVRSMMCFEDV